MPLDPLLDAVEQNIAEDLRVEDLAGAGFISRAQLYREFYNETGHSVKEYIRKRRLSRALMLIKHTDLPLTQIAQECGFGSQQALCKGVKAVTGQTPLQYKESGDEFYFPACDGHASEEGQARAVTVAAETIPSTLRLRYYDSCLQGIENRALARLFAALPGYRGRVFGRNGQQKGQKLCYELYIACESPVSVGGFAQAARAPAFSGTFAKTACPNIEAEINAAWDYLYDDWLKTSMFAMAAQQPWGAQPYFEEYIHAGGQVKRLQLYLPVQKRPGFHKIRLCRCGDMRFLVSRKSGANAEKAASRAVMDFLAAHSPGLAHAARQFYVSTAEEGGPGLHLVRENIYACGIQLQAPIHPPPNCEAQMRTHPTGEYAVLEGDCCGDSGVYASVLAAWIEGMGLRAAGAPFAVYEAEGGFDERDIRVKIYQAIES